MNDKLYGDLSSGAEIATGYEFQRNGQLDEAAQIYRTILEREPNNYEALHLLGRISLTQGRCEEAEYHLARSIEINPHDPLAHGVHGVALMQLLRLDEALASFDRAIALKPDYREAFNDRANVLVYLQRFDESLVAFDRAISLTPDNASTFYNRGIALHKAERPDEAFTSFERAIELKSDYPEAFNYRGVVLIELRRPDEALASFDRAIALKPDYAEAYLNRGLCKLALGRMASGWSDFEYRWKQKDYGSKRPVFDAPHWSGENLRGRSILVYDEEGLGDTIQFCRYLPRLVEQGARVGLLIRSNLSRLLASMTRETRDIRIVKSIGPGDRFDFQIPLLSLPYRLGVDLAHLQSGAYLSAEPELASRWAANIRSTGFKIGICWQGNPQSRIDVGRSIPLRAFHKLSLIPGVRLISLQKNYGLDQLSDMPGGMKVENLGEDFDAGRHAFVDSAAVMEHLDLIITSDTSVAHLAGALGRPTWVALKHVPDWRWMLDRRDCPWYPTMRLFRQRTPGDWASVFHDISIELNALLARRSVVNRFLTGAADLPRRLKQLVRRPGTSPE